MRTILLLMLVVFQVSANDKTLQVAINLGPPWAFYEQDNGVVGIDVDILTHIFSELGYDTEFHLLAYNRLIADFKAGKYDVASPAAFDTEVGYLTTPYLPYQDVAVSLRSKGLKIQTFEDLAGKRIIAYQGAKWVLGEEFAAVVETESYLEEVGREVQLTLLLNDRADVVVGERRLLTYIMNKHFPDHALTIHPIFETKPYGAIIKDPALQADFEKKLESMQASGLYQTILDRWQ